MSDSTRMKPRLSLSLLSAHLPADLCLLTTFYLLVFEDLLLVAAGFELSP